MCNIPQNHLEPDALLDVDVLRAFQRTTGEPGDAEADALLDEIIARQLDI